MIKKYYDEDLKLTVKYDPDKMIDWIDYQNKYRKEKGLPLISKEKKEKIAAKSRTERYYDLKKIKAIPLEEVAVKYGAQLRASGDRYYLHCILPTHTAKNAGDKVDKNSSAVIYTDTNRYYCFAEGVSLTVTDFVGVMEGMSIKEAKSPNAVSKECQMLAKLMSLDKKSYKEEREVEFSVSDLTFIGIKHSEMRKDIPEINVKVEANIKDYLEPATFYYFVASKAIDKISEIHDRQKIFCDTYRNDNSSMAIGLWNDLVKEEERASDIYDRAKQKLALIEKNEVSHEYEQEEEDTELSM